MQGVSSPGRTWEDCSGRIVHGQGLHHWLKSYGNSIGKIERGKSGNCIEIKIFIYNRMSTDTFYN